MHTSGRLTGSLRHPRSRSSVRMHMQRFGLLHNFFPAHPTDEGLYEKTSQASCQNCYYNLGKISDDVKTSLITPVSQRGARGA